jgi:DNA-binding CsgD family transcriptional regulator
VYQTKSVAIYKMMEMFFEQASIGVLMTDSRGMILWSNQLAREMGKEFAGNGSDIILNNLSSFDEDITDIQQAIMDMSEVLSCGKSSRYTSQLKPGFTFYSIPVTVTNIMGNAESRNLVFIHAGNKNNVSYESLTSCLTRRECQILDSLLNGTHNDDISKQFSISPNTVRTHISTIYKKLGVKNKADIFIAFKNRQP